MLVRLKISTYIGKLLKTTSFWQDNKIILREFKYFRTIAIIALTCTLLAALFEGTTVGLIASFLQVLTTPEKPPLETGIQWLDINLLATKASPEARIYRLSAFILVAIWLRSLLNYLGLYYSRLAQSNLCDRLRKRLFEQFQSLSLSYYTTSRSGDLINSLTTEINQLKQAFDVFSGLITRGSTLVAYIISMFWLSWQLSLAALSLYTLLSVGLSTLIRRVRQASFSIPQANGQLASIGIQFINGIRTVKGSATEDFERKRFYQASQDIIRAEERVAGISALVQPLAEGTASTILIVMVIVAFNLFISKGNLQTSSLLTFMFVLFRMMPLVSQVNTIREYLGRFQGSVNNIQELLKTKNKPYLDNGTLQFKGLKQGISFLLVNFGYEFNNFVLKNIKITIEKGKVTAIVGGSGAGKSTLVDLIIRFYDPTEGSILLDGKNLKDFDIASVRRKMAIVSQDTFIFNASVRDNIAYGLEKLSEEDIWQAAKLAHAVEFIKELPDGLDTVLGDRGVRLSGGQKQRIAIARALLRNPDILILDEATSALDSVTEKLIQESLEKLTQGRTVIAIAHRLSTIAKADKIVVLEEGRIIEQGSYQNLLARKAALWKYHQMQHQLTN
ncbi:Xenobiotic-transporting ATPase [Stanieria cyanosphaera PCC 7437]|uniref:Xenobiotic-transporting ATPase n=1 Tax=Stanieria cyanosphaera (strain ATCC 29371 / PCC 7437) TaxID=111780 RepID=K9XP32_STAC7|nr:heterocyst formation ABC transporter subunit HepA [Stanieria cyanosphaera]AFZ34370.1 Xenobiotic-transporting ATPase [Stanieria cyanosphaera PCC 7437]